MSALEREIIEKFHQLDPDAQKRVREIIDQQQADPAKFDYEAWLRKVEAIRQNIKASHGGAMPPVDVVGILRDLRDGEDE